MDHPAVAQAVTFAVPDPALGEQVAAAVVLRNSKVTERELRQYAASRLTDFKVPLRILILDEIPKGPTGKLQRIGLAEKVGLTLVDMKLEPVEQKPYIAPRNSTEEKVAKLWRQVLGIEQASIQQSFFDLGGDSVLALQLAGKVHEEFAVEIALLDLYDTATIEGQAIILNRLVSDLKVD